MVIEDGVHIGSNTAIDKGSLGNTVIKKNARVDNLVHIAHNVIIGENSMIVANSMIAGSCEIGDNTWVSPSVSLLDTKKIGENS